MVVCQGEMVQSISVVVMEDEVNEDHQPSQTFVSAVVRAFRVA